MPKLMTLLNEKDQLKNKGQIIIGDLFPKEPPTITFLCEQVKVSAHKDITLIATKPDFYGNLLDYGTIVFDVADKKTTYIKLSPKELTMLKKMRCKGGIS